MSGELNPVPRDTGDTHRHQIVRGGRFSAMIRREEHNRLPHESQTETALILSKWLSADDISAPNAIEMAPIGA